MRLQLEDIFIAGKLPEAKKIDFDDPKIKALFDKTKREQEEVKLLMEWTQEDYDRMNQVITI